MDIGAPETRAGSSPSHAIDVGDFASGRIHADRHRTVTVVQRRETALLRASRATGHLYFRAASGEPAPEPASTGRPDGVASERHPVGG
jgi:hypothetical protein